VNTRLIPKTKNIMGYVLCERAEAPTKTEPFEFLTEKEFNIGMTRWTVKRNS